MGGTCSAYGGDESMYRNLVWKPEGKSPFGRPKHRCEDNINKDLQEVECGVTDWIELTRHTNKWHSLVYAAMKLSVP